MQSYFFWTRLVTGRSAALVDLRADRQFHVVFLLLFLLLHFCDVGFDFLLKGFVFLLAVLHLNEVHQLESGTWIAVKHARYYVFGLLSHRNIFVPFQRSCLDQLNGSILVVAKVG